MINTEKPSLISLLHSLKRRDESDLWQVHGKWIEKIISFVNDNRNKEKKALQRPRRLYPFRTETLFYQTRRGVRVWCGVQEPIRTS